VSSPSASVRRQEILDTAAELLASGSGASVTDIAEACGILPGSLYHHFESKDAIVAELIARYRDDLDAVARSTLSRPLGSDRLEQRTIALAREIAHCALDHRAALVLTVFDQDAALDDDVEGTPERPVAGVVRAMRHLLDEGLASGQLRAEVPTGPLAERLVQSMLNHSTGPMRLRSDAEDIIGLRCRLLLEGVGAAVPDDEVLDRSRALATAHEVAEAWNQLAGTDRDTTILAAARAEFGRRGYERSTMRGIAAAAGLAPQAVYRRFPSKEELFAAVMRTSNEQRRVAWDAVVRSWSSPVEKLDALAWLNIRAVEHFRDELRIHLGWIRATSPGMSQLGTTEAQRRDILGIVDAGIGVGEFRFDPGPVDDWTRFLFETLWTPAPVLRSVGAEAAHALARQTLLRGALARA
jgi:AcrR family transcriptional regulator